MPSKNATVSTVAVTISLKNLRSHAIKVRVSEKPFASRCGMRTKGNGMSLRSLIVAMALFALVSCGGGGSGSSLDPPASVSTPTYLITGTITEGATTGVSGVTVTLSGASSASTVTDASGNYSFSGLGSGNYTMTPSLTGYTFSPADLAVTVTGADVTGQNFTATPPAAIQLPKTGQTASYAADDDGAEQQGVAWPNPRFTNNSDGTVSDNLTGLVWLKNANCFGGSIWSAALTHANTLANGACGLTDGSTVGQWRLPNVNELRSLVDYSQSNPPLPSGYPFTGVVSTGSYPYYWTSTTNPLDLGGALSIGMYAGDVYYWGTASSMYVWPVRSGQTTGTAQVAQTGQTLCYDGNYHQIPCSGTGQDADKAAGAGWPSPRFTDNGNGTITDNLTGLVWLKNGNCFGTVATWGSALTDAVGLASGACGLTDGSTAGQWRLPNVDELASLLTNESQANVGTWLNSQGFSNAAGDFWSSSTYAITPGNAWTIGGIYVTPNYNKNTPGIFLHVWPVRSQLAD